MSQIQITLPDGNIKEVEKGTLVSDFVSKMSISLAKAALAAKVDGVEVDLSYPLEKNSRIEILTYATKEGKEVFHHSSAHLLGMAVQRLWPDALLTVGPVVESGPGFFYYDIDFPSVTITPEDLVKIEKEMEKIVKDNLPVKRTVLTKDKQLKNSPRWVKNIKLNLSLDLTLIQYHYMDKANGLTFAVARMCLILVCSKHLN